MARCRIRVDPPGDMIACTEGAASTRGMLRFLHRDQVPYYGRIVFIAQAADQLQGAIFLLDAPGLSLHDLKQRECRKTLSRLTEDNQLLCTTHSPFLVGSDELDVVRVVEMTDRHVGAFPEPPSGS
jgi:hypothetical protein